MVHPKKIETQRVTQVETPDNGIPSTLAENLRELRNLTEEGLITTEEFEAKKKQLLDI